MCFNITSLFSFNLFTGNHQGEDPEPVGPAAGGQDHAGVAAGLPDQRGAQPPDPGGDAIHGRPPGGQVCPLHALHQGQLGENEDLDVHKVKN